MRLRREEKKITGERGAIEDLLYLNKGVIVSHVY